MPQIFKDC